uniref:NADAR domain-containing protein n=1 Tax=Strongyloides venezuelensis TaxID=75913 RepID=A0A0K0G301_STRVS
MPFFKDVNNSSNTTSETMKDDVVLFKNYMKIMATVDKGHQTNDTTTKLVIKSPTSTKTTKKRFDIIRRTLFKENHPPKKVFRKRQVVYNNRWDEEGDENLRELSIPKGIRTLNIKIEPSNVLCIEDASSIYSPVYKVNKLRYHDIYFRSVDEGYQYYKLLHLCNRPFSFPGQAKSRTSIQRSYVKRCLAENNKTRVDVVRWRQEKGLKILFELTLQKFIQNPDLYKIMEEDKNKLILHVHGEDNYDACGRIEDLQVWLEENLHREVKIPVTNDLDNLQLFPNISTGKNIQGIIIMLVRELLEENEWC